MNKSILILLIYYSVSFGQISLTSDDFLGLIGTTGIVLADTTDSITVNVGSAGENQIWDFSSLHLQGIIENYSFEHPNQTVFVDSFPKANFIQHVSYDNDQSIHEYTFFDIKPHYMNVVGYAYDTPQGNIVKKDSNKTSLPINYSNSWKRGWIDTVSFSFPLFDSTFISIDAWGTITVPAGTFECLRFRYDKYFTYVKRTTGFPPRIIIIDTSTVSYEWYTKDQFLVASVEIPGSEPDLNFTNARNVSLLQDVVISSVAENVNIKQPHAFILHQNYPNPFNPSTNINFSLLKSSKVKIEIYNMLGKKIKTLLNESLSAGNHSVVFNAQNIVSGVYLYRIEAGEYSDIKKMILLK